MLIDARHPQHVRWQPGERMNSLFEEVVDDLAAAGQAARLAVDSDDEQVTYADLDARANQLARHLRAGGVQSGDRVGLLLDRPLATYVAMLGILKAGAAYVPLDASFPPDRLAYICADAGAGLVLTHSNLRSLITDEVAAWCLDERADAVASESTDRVPAAEHTQSGDALAYVIYTSGTTGRPKGVAINHSSICNFLRVASEVYGYAFDDRVYQGMTVAFDFSVEELWVPWMVGATLVPKPPGGALVGADLRDFLVRRRISALCCVPTLLASIEDDVPGLRFLLVSGESCPHDLVVRWYRDDRRFLNVYGPTEATVTATWTPLLPDRRVTIGVPLPTYSVLIRDPETGAEVPDGASGEICVGGIGLAAGYLNRPELTDHAFIPDTHGVPQNPSHRLYRTGDLGRVDANGEIEFLGRIDLQVKIRGYRIELNEIESVIMEFPGVAVAVVEPYRPEPGVTELAAYISVRSDTAPVDPLAVQQFLKDRVPAYMVPAYIEQLAIMPMLPSDKVDRKSLPPVSAERRLRGGAEVINPQGPAEVALASVLADLLRIREVSATAHFFDDLGADSLIMAKFCSRVRQLPGGWSPVMKDVYVHPTVRLLAAALTPDATVHPLFPAADDADLDAAPAPRRRRASSWSFVACGAAQVAVFAAVSYVVAVVLTMSAEWLVGAATPTEVFLRSVALTLALLAFTLVVPVLAKWVLIGRWRAQDIRVWSPAYLRFWVVRLLLGISPARLFVGSPFYSVYLRALGARVGPRVTIHSPGFLCTDLLTVGADTVIQKESLLLGYRVEDGVIQTGRVTLGSNVWVGESTVLDIDTAIGDDAQIGHASGLLRGQRIPAGEHWGGLPAEPMDADFQTVPPTRWRRWRPVAFTTMQVVWPTLIAALIPSALILAIRAVPAASPLLDLGHLPWADGAFLGLYVAATAVLFLSSLLVSVLFVWTVPRLFNLVLRPGRVYPLFGFHHVAQRFVTRLTNTPLTPLFGDSSYITGFLSRLGYRLKPIVQTGSNFGMAVRHDNPYLVTIGTGTMVSDGLSLHNAEFSHSSFRVRHTVIGRDSFLGNTISYPVDARLGDNVLLGTKVMVPVSGERRANTGLLGSPPFEIPRSVQRDAQFEEVVAGAELRRSLRRKRRYNTATIGWSLLVRWLIGAILGASLVLAVDLVPTFGTWVLALQLFLAPLLGASLSILAERAAMGFQRLSPQLCSIYDPYFWKHERFWKMSGGGPALFNGTPMKSLVWRALGVRVGRRLFDDGCGIVERSLVSIGDDCTLNRGSTVQAHSLEDGAFKSDRIVLGDRVTLGVAGFLHYGTEVGDGAVIEADSFVMKGAEIEAGERWFGNPAHPGGRLSYASPVTRHTGAEVTLVDRLRAPGVRDALTPAPGIAVHVFSLSACAAHLDDLLAWLPAADRRAAGRIASPSRHLRFVASRALVPVLMHLHRDVPATDADPSWGLTTEAGGRPLVWGPDPTPEASISYADDLMAIGFGRQRELGIDLATAGPRTPIVPEALAEAELTLLGSLPPKDRPWTFLKMWTLKEAYAKCCGTGASFDFSSFDTATHLPTLTQQADPDNRRQARFHHRILWHRGQRYWLAVAARPLSESEAPRRALFEVAPRMAQAAVRNAERPAAVPHARAGVDLSLSRRSG